MEKHSALYMRTLNFLLILSQEGTTLGDPLAMPMYADFEVSQMWYAEDASAGDSLESFHSWWDSLICFGPDIGHY